MAATTATDYTMIANVMSGYAAATLTDKLGALQAGIIRERTDVEFRDSNVVKFRGDIEDTGAWETTTAATDATINAISHYVDLAVIGRRGKAWGVEDMAKLVGGDENALARWNSAIQQNARLNIHKMFFTYLVPALFNTAGPLDSASHKIEVGGQFTMDLIPQAKSLRGEWANEFSIMVMHPTVYHNAQINLLATNLDYATIAQYQERGVAYGGMLGGMRVILDENLYNTASTTKLYHTYIFRPGALELGWQKQLDVTAWRDEDAAFGTDKIKYVVALSPHMNGITWNTTEPTALGGATDAQIGAGASWTTRTSITNNEIPAVCIESTEA